MTPPNVDLTTTVANLERQVRRLRVAFGAAVLVLGAAVLTAWTFPQGQTMTARQYLILDDDGIPRGNFGVLADGASVGMMFTDLNGMTRAEVRVDPDGLPRVALLDDQERVRTEVGMAPDGTPSVILAHAEGEQSSPRAALSVSGAGTGQLMFIGVDGNTRQAMIGTLEDGRPLLLLLDDSGEVYWQPTPGPAPADTTG